MIPSFNMCPPPFATISQFFVAIPPSDYDEKQSHRDTNIAGLDMQNLQVRHAKFASLDMQKLHPSLPDIVNLTELNTISDFFELLRETTGANRARGATTQEIPQASPICPPGRPGRHHLLIAGTNRPPGNPRPPKRHFLLCFVVRPENASAGSLISKSKSVFAIRFSTTGWYNEPEDSRKTKKVFSSIRLTISGRLVSNFLTSRCQVY
jgi:hypothetical protein